MNNNEVNVTSVDSAVNSTEKEGRIDLVEFFFYLLNKLWIILLVAVICGAAAYFYVRFTTVPLYQSTAKIYLIQKTEIINTSNLSFARNTVDDCVDIISDAVVVEDAINNLGLGMSYSSIKSRMSVSSEEDSLIISVSVSDTDPQTACNLANEICNVSITKVKDIVGLDQINIMSYGKVASNPFNLTFASSTAKAALIGFLGACAILFIVFYFDDKIKSSEDIERYLGLTVLGVIPRIENKEQERD